MSDDPMMNMDPEDAIASGNSVPWDIVDPDVGGSSGGGSSSMTSNADREHGIDWAAINKEYIMKGLARLYRKKILPLELSSRYGHFHSPPLSPADFDAPPSVLLLGPFR